jgi:hypothetical protein
MGFNRNLLKADRVLRYKKLPVPEGWHEAYTLGEVSATPDWSEKVAQVEVR